MPLSRAPLVGQILKRGCAYLVLFLLAPLCAATPWMDAGDSRLRHHIQVLADATLIRVPVNTWPLMWSGVIHDVSLVRGKVLSPAQRRAVEYITVAFERQTGTHYHAAMQVAERRNPLRGFGDTRRDEQNIHLAADYVGEVWAGRLQVGWAENPLDERQYQLDGSYLTGLWGNWAFTMGSLDRWWGPGWESGLILSNNARPIPGFSIQRNASEPFNIGLLRWMGPWQLVVFAGQLEEDRAVENAKLLGARFSFRPLHWLELGLSRTAQWGGEGRPQGFSSFADVVLGKDNVDAADVAAGNEPSNQLAGLDWRASWSNGAATVDFYGEFIGEDEAGSLPSRYITTLGLGSTFSVRGSELRVYYESTDTAAERRYGNARYDYAYEHSTYQTGYRYRGRAIGASIDNDSRADHLGVHWYPDLRNSVELRVSQLDFRENVRGTDSVSNLGSKGYSARLAYQHQRADWSCGLRYSYYDSKLLLNNFDGGENTVELSAAVHW